MARGPLFESDYRPLFSGHQTFPLRYGWLKKAFDAVSNSSEVEASKQVFLDDAAIAQFGVGKNMVDSIRHWATCCGVIADGENAGSLKTTWFADQIFGPKGVDPYLEDRSALWLLHWNLASGRIKPIKTTWFWAFSHFPHAQFRRDDLVTAIVKFAEARSWARVSKSTVQRDVDCFVRTYESHPFVAGESVEDSIESPLAELGLLRGHKGNFQFVKGNKVSLTSAVFAIALNDFWESYGTTRTLSFEAIAHEPGSPGRVFLLDEAAIGERLLGLEDATEGVLHWSETAGLKQVLRDRPLEQREIKRLLRVNYDKRMRLKAA